MAATEPCVVCSKRHRSEAAAAKCNARAATGPAQPGTAAAPGPAVPAGPVTVTTDDVLAALHLLDGRLVLTATGTVLATAPSIPGAPLPRQVATGGQIVSVLVDLSGADFAEVTRAFRAALRRGKPLSMVIPRALLTAAADCLTLEARHIAATLTSSHTDGHALAA